jgi:chromate transporter
MTHILYLYYLFAKIGVFTFGGGYAMIPLFQDELVTRHQYMGGDEFAALVALAQITPGPVGLNAATYVGYQQAGVLGAASATLGMMTPSLIVVMLAAVFLSKFRNSVWLQQALEGIRPVVLGLIGAAVIFFAETSVFSAPLKTLWEKSGVSFGICWQGLVIFALVLFIEIKWKVNQVWLLLGAGILALILMEIRL